jgi:integrase
MARRKGLPVRQRHADGCPGRNCACPWSFRVRLPDGTQPRVTRDSYEDAEQAYHELMSRRPGPLADRTTTIAEWAKRWQESAHWRRATRTGHELTVRLHIDPYIGHILVTELTRDDVRLWAAQMRKNGVGQATQVKAVEDLRTMYGVWLEDGRLLPGGVPIPRGLVKRTPRKEFTPLTTAQVQAWAAAMPVEMALLVEIEAFYGGRMSEVLGLRGEDLIWIGKDTSAPLPDQLAQLAGLPPDRYDARKPRVRFERQLARVTRVSAPPKNTRATRTLPLPRWLAVKLAAQLAQWPPAGGWLFVNRRAPGGYSTVLTDEERAEARREAMRRSRARRRGEDIPLRRAGAKPGGTGFHFTPDGKPYHAARYNVWLHRAADSAGIVLPPNQCSHALRHHCVSVLRARGWSDQDIGAWIGDTAQTVAQVYGRPMPGSLDRIAAALSNEREATGPPLRAV